MDKSKRYWHLKREVGLLEEGNNKPSLLEAIFLEMDDEKAATLNNKIIK